MNEFRQAGQRIAADYDALVYEVPADPALRPSALLGFARAYGCAGRLGDVLDLGCGTGAQLQAAAEDTAGRLVGADLSQENCRRANERLGDRAQIYHADLMDLTPAQLGQFDLIYTVGLLYAVPPPVRAQALRLIGECLRPGGIALITYYGGTMFAARNWLHRQVRAQMPPDLAPTAAVTKGREILTRLARQPSASIMTPQAATLTASLTDAAFFHEVLNPWIEPVSASELDGALSAAKVRFLCHLETPTALPLADPLARAREADRRDVAGGGYHHALFGKIT